MNLINLRYIIAEGMIQTKATALIRTATAQTKAMALIRVLVTIRVLIAPTKAMVQITTTLVLIRVTLISIRGIMTPTKALMTPIRAITGLMKEVTTQTLTMGLIRVTMDLTMAAIGLTRAMTPTKVTMVLTRAAMVPIKLMDQINAIAVIIKGMDQIKDALGHSTITRAQTMAMGLTRVITVQIRAIMVPITDNTGGIKAMVLFKKISGQIRVAVTTKEVMVLKVMKWTRNLALTIKDTTGANKALLIRGKVTMGATI